MRERQAEALVSSDDGVGADFDDDYDDVSGTSGIHSSPQESLGNKLLAKSRPPPRGMKASAA
jgi:hypothetical protein